MARESERRESDSPAKIGFVFSIALLSVMGALWGLAPALVKLSTQSDLPYFDIFSIGIFGPAVCFLVYIAAQRAWFRLTPGRLAFFLASGLFGIFLPFLVRVLAASHLPAGLMALIVSTTPVMAVALALLFRTEVVSLQRGLGVGLGVFAAGLILWPDATLVSVEQSLWALFHFLIPLSYAIGQVIIYRLWPAGLSAGQVAAGDSLVAAVIFLPLFVVWGDPAALFGTWRAGTGPILLWVLVIFAATVIFFALIRRQGPIFASSGTFIAIFSGFLWGRIFFAESLSTMMLIATALFVLSLVIIFRYQPRPSETAPQESQP